MRFSFTGTVICSSSEKHPFFKEGTDKNNERFRSLNFSVSTGKNNTGYVEVYGTERKGKGIRYKAGNGQSVTVDWDDRLDEDEVGKAPSYIRYVAAFEEKKRKEFLSAWDFAKYVSDHAEEINEKRFTINGRVRRSIDKGRIYNHFEVQGIYPVKENLKDRLRVTGEVYFTADDIVLSDWNKEKKATISGYTYDYISAESKKMYLSQDFIFDASKIDPKNEKQLAQAKINASELGIELDSEMKAKVALKKKKVYRNNFICSYVNGSEPIEFDESMLTAHQKEKIASGKKTLEDYRPTGQAYGERTVMFKVIDCDDTREYADGIVLDAMSIDEFAENIYQPELPAKTAEEALEEGMNAPEPAAEPETDMDDLFG